MSKLQRLLGVVVVLIMLFGSISSVAIAEQGSQTGTSTQGGGQAGPNRAEPTPEPVVEEPVAQEPVVEQPVAQEPVAEQQQPVAEQPVAQEPAVDNSGTVSTSAARTSTNVSTRTGAQGPSRPAPAPRPQQPPQAPPSNNGGGGGGGTATGPLRVVVDLSSQMAYVYRGTTQIKSTYVNTGKRGFETPTGTFYINSKYRYDDMRGREGGESWDVRNVPYAMYFTNRGHALHGAPWARSFGSPRSHGCVNLPMDFAAWLFNNAPIGTKVIVQW